MDLFHSIPQLGTSAIEHFCCLMFQWLSLSGQDMQLLETYSTDRQMIPPFSKEPVINFRSCFHPLATSLQPHCLLPHGTEWHSLKGNPWYLHSYMWIFLLATITTHCNNKRKLYINTGRTGDKSCQFFAWNSSHHNSWTICSNWTAWRPRVAGTTGHYNNRAMMDCFIINVKGTWVKERNSNGSLQSRPNYWIILKIEHWSHAIATVAYVYTACMCSTLPVLVLVVNFTNLHALTLVNHFLHSCYVCFIKQLIVITQYIINAGKHIPGCNCSRSADDICVLHIWRHSVGCWCQYWFRCWRWDQVL